MCLYGTAVDGVGSISSASQAFYINNVGGTTVMKWDTAGALSFLGDACYYNGAWTGI